MKSTSLRSWAIGAAIASTLAGLMVACRTNGPTRAASGSRGAHATSVPLVPSAPPGSGGLLARYGDGRRQVVTVARSPNYVLDAGESVHPAVGPAFEASYEGLVDVPAAGRFEWDAAGGTLTIDGQKVDGPRALTAGKHTFALSVRRAPGPARMQVRWKSDGFPWEPVPIRAFTHRGLPAEGERWRRIDRGRALLDELNCRGCHTRPGDNPQSDAFRDETRRGRGPLLGAVGRRTTSAWMKAWLADPRSYRPQAKMPVVLHAESDRSDVAAFLGTLRGEGYAPRGSDVIDIDAHEPTAAELDKGKALYESIGCTACHGEGALQVSLAAVGSKMPRASLFSYLANTFTPGEPDQSGRMPLLLRSVDEALVISQHLATFQRPGAEGRAFTGGDVARGRQLVMDAGCLGCHELTVDGDRLPSRVAAPGMDALRAGKGCLAPSPKGRAVRYALSDEDRADLALALENRDAAPAPSWEWKRLVDNRRCQSCHEVDQPAGTTFSETPPPLTEVGHKLRPQWIQQVVVGRVRVRPWLQVRMPRFHQPGEIGRLFASVAGETVEAAPSGAPAEPEIAVREGVRFLGRGEEGLSCITCHDVGTWKSGSATPAPDISTMHDRLRPEWFRRWLLDPPRIQPGTQMPAYFAEVDRSVADKKIEAVWAALAKGKSMPNPEGVTFENRAVPFEVGKTPAVVRTFLANSSTRTVAIGFPGGHSFAWDAEKCRLVRAWEGGFLDMRPVWFERGGREAGQMGATTYVAANESSLRVGDPGREPSAVRFHGYTTQPRVALSYSVDGAEVNETIKPLAGGRFERSFDVTGAPGGAWFVSGDPAGARISARGASAAGPGRFHAKAAAGRTRFTVVFTPQRSGAAVTTAAQGSAATDEAAALARRRNGQGLPPGARPARDSAARN